MHLAHRIPWNSVAEHLEFVADNHCASGRTDIFPRDVRKGLKRGEAHRGNKNSKTATSERSSDTGASPVDAAAAATARRASDLNHFVRSFITALREFSKTEIDTVSKTHAAHGSGPDDTPLFPDTLLDLSNHPFRLGPYETNNNRANALTASHQQLHYWQERVRNSTGEEEEEEEDNAACYYTTEHGDLADSVKLLIQLGQSRALLRLLRSPPHLRGIMSMGWGHSFGVNHVPYETLPPYLLLNLGYAVRQRSLADRMVPAGVPVDPRTGLPRGVSPKKQLGSLYALEGLRKLVLESFTDYDYAAQFIMHRAFWSKYADPSATDPENVYAFLSTDSGSRDTDYVDSTTSAAAPPDPTLTDAERTKAYLADCFRSLYLVDMILLEQHGGAEEPVNDFWHDNISHALRQVCNLPWSSVACNPVAGDDNRWSHRFV